MTHRRARRHARRNRSRRSWLPPVAARPLAQNRLRQHQIRGGGDLDVAVLRPAPAAPRAPATPSPAPRRSAARPSAMRALERRAQRRIAEHLRRLRAATAPRVAPSRRTGARRLAGLAAPARALDGIGDRHRQQRPDRIRGPVRSSRCQIARAQAGPRGIVHQHPVVGVRRALAARAGRCTPTARARRRRRPARTRAAGCAAQLRRAADHPAASARLPPRHCGSSRKSCSAVSSTVRRPAPRTAWHCRSGGRRLPPASRASSASARSAARRSRPLRALPAAPARIGAAAGAGRLRRHHLVEGLVAGDHAQIAAGALLERGVALLQVAHFGGELSVALRQRARSPPAARPPPRAGAALRARRRPTATAGTAAAAARQTATASHFMAAR